MSEQPEQTRRPGGDEPTSVPAGDGGDRESVRTAGETSVDEDLGGADDPAR